GILAFIGFTQLVPADDNTAKPYKILATTQIPAAGGIDYVTADSVNRRVYVACGNQVSVFDLDSYKLVGTLANASGHGVVVDPETLKVTGHFDLGEKGKGPAGLAIDTKNHILFAMCRGESGGTPMCVILSTVDGKVITMLPLAGRSDGAVFNPRTGEAFSSH